MGSEALSSEDFPLNPIYHPEPLPPHVQVPVPSFLWTPAPKPKLGSISNQDSDFRLPASQISFSELPPTHTMVQTPSPKPHLGIPTSGLPDLGNLFVGRFCWSSPSYSPTPRLPLHLLARSLGLVRRLGQGPPILLTPPCCWE